MSAVQPPPPPLGRRPSQATGPKNPELVSSYYQLIDREDLDGVLRLFADDAVYRRPGYSAFVGKNSIAAFYGSERVIESGSHTLRTLLAKGDTVAVEGTFRGVLKDGRVVAQEFADFFSLRAGLIVERCTYFNAAAI